MSVTDPDANGGNRFYRRPDGSRQPAPPRTARRRFLLVAGRAVVGLLVPLAIYYGLRAADVAVYAAILVSTLASAVPSIVGLVRNGRVMRCLRTSPRCCWAASSSRRWRAAPSSCWPRKRS